MDLIRHSAVLICKVGRAERSDPRRFTLRNGCEEQSSDSKVCFSRVGTVRTFAIYSGGPAVEHSVWPEIPSLCPSYTLHSGLQCLTYNVSSMTR